MIDFLLPVIFAVHISFLAWLWLRDRQMRRFLCSWLADYNEMVAASNNNAEAVNRFIADTRQRFEVISEALGNDAHKADWWKKGQPPPV